MSPLIFGSVPAVPSVAADPSSPVNGDIWLRSDDGVLRYQDGQTIHEAPATRTPLWGTQTWQRLQDGPQQNITCTLNQMYAVPLFPPRLFQLTDVAIAVTTAATSGVARIGLYAAFASGLPGTLIQEIGSVSTAAVSTGLVLTLSTPVTLVPATMYYLSLVAQGVSGAAFRGRGSDDTLILASASTPNLTGVNNSILNANATTSGVLPFVWGTPHPTGSPTGGPEFLVRGN